jgi:hypothetical protein
MQAIPILDYLRRFGLAAVCVLGPFLLVNFGTDFAVGLLVRHEKDQRLPAGVTYKLLDAEGPISTAPAGGTKPAEKSDAEKKAESDLKRMEVYARHIAGRYSFSVGSGFVYLVSAVAALFAGLVIYQRVGWIGLGIAVAASCGLAAYVTSNETSFPYARPLVMDWIFATADQDDNLKQLATGTDSTAAAVNRLMKIGTFVGVAAVGLLIAVFCLAAVRTQGPTLDDLRRRLREIRVALVLASTILVLYVLVSKLLLQWPLSLLADAQRPAFQKIADAVLLHWSSAATIVLLMMSLPAAFAWWLDVDAYRRGTQAETGVAAEDGLRFAPLPAMGSLMVALAPLLASPFADTIKSVIGALPVK